MDYREIKIAKITCKECKTSISVPINAENYKISKERDFDFSCPTCGKDLSEIMKTARHHALQYNKACQEAESLEEAGCIFEQEF